MKYALGTLTAIYRLSVLAMLFIIMIDAENYQRASFELSKASLQALFGIYGKLVGT